MKVESPKRPAETQCHGKVRYLTKAKAKLAARRMKGREHAVEAYRCPWCHYWHLGRKRRARQVAAEAA